MRPSNLHRFRHLPVVFMLFATACAPSQEEEGETSESGLQTIGRDAMVGTIALGESVVVSYTKTPLYRVLR